MERFAGRGDERREDLRRSVVVPGQQVRARPADVEHRIRRKSGGGRPPDAGGLGDVAAVEQQSQQFRPGVPTPFADRREQQVAAARAEPAFFITRQQPLPLGGENGVRILRQQLSEPKPHRGVLG